MNNNENILDNIFICYTTKDGKKVFLDFELNKISEKTTNDTYNQIKNSYLGIDLNRLPDSCYIQCMELEKKKTINDFKQLKNLDYDKFYIKDVLYVQRKDNEIRISTMNHCLFLADIPDCLFYSLPRSLPEYFIPITPLNNMSIPITTASCMSKKNKVTTLYINRHNVECSSVDIDLDFPKQESTWISFRFKDQFRRHRGLSQYSRIDIQIECLQSRAKYFKDYYKIHNKKNLLKACE